MHFVTKLYLACALLVCGCQTPPAPKVEHTNPWCHGARVAQAHMFLLNTWPHNAIVSVDGTVNCVIAPGIAGQLHFAPGRHGIRVTCQITGEVLVDTILIVP